MPHALHGSRNRQHYAGEASYRRRRCCGAQKHVVIGTAAAVLALATANIMNSQSATQPLIDRVLGLPAVTVAAAYTFDNVLDIEGR